MKKTIFTIIAAALLACITLSCQKKETIEFAFATNPYARAAEISSNIQTFAFVTPNDWTISWDPVEWITIDESQFSGKASKSSKDYYTIVMNIDRLRKNKDRTVEFTVNEGGNEHVMVITQKAPLVPDEPLSFAQDKTYPAKGGEYSFNVPEKYEITVETEDDWITIGEVDYQKNTVPYTVSELPDGAEARTGTIKVYLSNKDLLGTATIEQKPTV